MKIESFEKYIAKNYLGDCETSIHIEYAQLENQIQRYNDEWFQVVNSPTYLLHKMGYRIECTNEKRVIRKCLDELDRNNLDNSVLLCVSIIDKSMILKTKNRTLEKQVVIPLPDNNSPLSCKGNWGRDVGDSTYYLHLFSFDRIPSELIEECQNKKNVYIDLRDCTGGKIVQMLSFVSAIISKEISYTLANRIDQRTKIVVPQKTARIKIENVSFLVSNYTASSAEMLICLLRKNYPGSIYGEKTRGKWVIQEIVLVEDKYVTLPRYRFVHDTRSAGILEFDSNMRIVPEKDLSREIKERLLLDE